MKLFCFLSPEIKQLHLLLLIPTTTIITIFLLIFLIVILFLSIFIPILDLLISDDLLKLLRILQIEPIDDFMHIFMRLSLNSSILPDLFHIGSHFFSVKQLQNILNSMRF